MNVMMEVEKGFRLLPPPGCPNAVYKLMMNCWNPHRHTAVHSAVNTAVHTAVHTAGRVDFSVGMFSSP